MAVYLLVAYSLDYFRGSKGGETTKIAIERIYNAATFGASVMLLMGVFEPSVLAAIGTLKPFILFAGFAGAIYSLSSLRK